jgi:hypothetical protein
MAALPPDNHMTGDLGLRAGRQNPDRRRPLTDGLREAIAKINPGNAR